MSDFSKFFTDRGFSRVEKWKIRGEIKMAEFWLQWWLPSESSFAFSFPFCLSDTLLCVNECVSSFSFHTRFSTVLRMQCKGTRHDTNRFLNCRGFMPSSFSWLLLKTVLKTCDSNILLLRRACSLMIFRASFSANNDNGKVKNGSQVRAPFFFVSFRCLQQFRK